MRIMRFFVHLVPENSACSFRSPSESHNTFEASFESGFLFSTDSTLSHCSISIPAGIRVTIFSSIQASTICSSVIHQFRSPNSPPLLFDLLASHISLYFEHRLQKRRDLSRRHNIVSLVRLMFHTCSLLYLSL
jgi:hypothetical protein